MKQFLLSIIPSLLAIAIAGCSATPPPSPSTVAPKTLADEFMEMASELRNAGGFAVVGIAKSRSMALALNKAKADGRVKLADLLAKQTSDAQENVSNSFHDLAPKKVQHQTSNGIFTVYALMELNPANEPEAHSTTQDIPSL